MERPFRTVKEAHEILYHFHKPETEQQANDWLLRYLPHYNEQPHRSQAHSRLEDWLTSQPSKGIREMCCWEQFCRFAREPERRKVGIDARITVDGTEYEVEPDLAGETVILLWGLFDSELHVEFEGERTGPYYPVSGPIPLNRYRAFRKGAISQRAECIRNLAQQLRLPIAALTGENIALISPPTPHDIPRQSFPVATEDCYGSIIASKLAIAGELATALAKLSTGDRQFIDQLLSETLIRRIVLDRVRGHFRRHKKEDDHAS